MRPTILFPLFAAITTLKGVGPRLAPLYARLVGEKIVDLLWHLPIGIIDRTYAPKLRQAQKGRVATLTLTVVEHIPSPRAGKPYRIICTDGTDEITLTYFTAKGDYLSKLFPTDRPVVVSGNLERFGRGWSMSHPDYVVPVSRQGEIPKFETVYPLTEGLSRKMVRKTIAQALAIAPALPEWNDAPLMKREGWPTWKEALLAAHEPQSFKNALTAQGAEDFNVALTAPTPLPTSPSRGEELASSFCQQDSKNQKDQNVSIPSPPERPYPSPLAGEDRWGVGDASAQSDNTEPSPPPSHRRLAYDELLADQLALAVIRRHHRQADGRAIKGTGELQEKLLAALPFTLTDGQQTALTEIAADLAAPKKMLRLLQGDVGSGKTIVALIAMLQAVEAGFQTALMAPTEILAKQHAQRLREFLEPVGIEVGLLIGKSKAKERQGVISRLEDGSLKIVVGTHALFQSDVAFANLGLAVVDEQHRFGVQQRLQLSDKGRGVDILVMTATPIPRTLTLTAFGDMDVSRINEKPKGRHPIDTRLIDMGRLDEVIEGARRQLAKGAQIYWVCPLVEESEKSDLAAATQRADLLAERLGADKVGLVHGQLKTEAKDRAMAAFVAGETRLLVATTVIEVGVDVPTATLMIVEHAERFGLAQLHQLRGRIGRGGGKSTCLLMYQSPMGEVAKARLKMMRETEDGFQIAEEDLRLRGPGEVLGTRQSGLPAFRLADLSRDRDLIRMAHDDAKVILNQDPQLATPRGKALRTLLYLFEKDAAVRLFRAG